MRFKAAMGIFLVSALMLGSNFTQAAASTVKLVTLGDSLTAGYELPSEDAFPAKLEKALKAAGHDVAITNASVSGDTSADGLARADWSIADGTDGVILELGANDALRGLTPEDTKKNLDAIIARLKERKIAVLLAGMQAPPNMGPDYASRFNAIFPALAKKYDLTLYPLFVEAFILHPELKLADGMHPNAKGVDAAVAAFLPVAETFLGQIGTH
jgi:acyl-CoA thioesterase I